MGISRVKTDSPMTSRILGLPEIQGAVTLLPISFTHFHALFMQFHII